MTRNEHLEKFQLAMRQTKDKRLFNSQLSCFIREMRIFGQKDGLSQIQASIRNRK